MKLNDIIKNIAAQSGIPESDTALIALIGNPEISKIDVPDEVSTKLTAHRYTEESAKNDPKLKSYFTAQALDGLDAHALQEATRLGLNETDITELKGIKNTQKKISALAEKIAEKERQAAGATGKTKDLLTKEVDELNGKIASMALENEKTINELRQQHLGDRVNWELDGIYGKLDYAIPGLDKDTSIITAKTLIGKKASEKGVVFKSADGKLVLETTAGTKYFENNKEVNPSDFIQRTLLESKLLKVSQGSGKGPARTQGTPTPATDKVDSKDFAALNALVNEATVDSDTE